MKKTTPTTPPTTDIQDPKTVAIIAEALAFIHITGWLPAGMPTGIWGHCKSYTKPAASESTRLYDLKEEAANLVEKTVMLKKFRDLERQGFKLQAASKLQPWVEMRKIGGEACQLNQDGSVKEMEPGKQIRTTKKGSRK